MNNMGRIRSQHWWPLACSALLRIQIQKKSWVGWTRVQTTRDRITWRTKINILCDCNVVEQNSIWLIVRCSRKSSLISKQKSDASISISISGWVQQVKWCLHTGEQMPCWQTVAAGPFWPCFASPKLGDAGRTRVASKNRAVLRKAGQSQFWL